MISEEMLKKAADEAAQAITDSLPTAKECQYEFSTSFQRKMRRIFRITKHPIIYKFPKYAACFVLAVILASSTLLTLNTEVRAAFFAWVREQYESFVEYRFIGEAPQENTIVEYELTWLPEGFSFQKEQDLDGGSYLTYTHDSGRRIIFSYLQGEDAASLFVASDYTEIQSIQIGNIQADFYQASEEGSANALVWLSEKDDLFFCIMTNLSEDTMIKLARGVQKK